MKISASLGEARISDKASVPKWSPEISRILYINYKGDF